MLRTTQQWRHYGLLACEEKTNVSVQRRRRYLHGLGERIQWNEENLHHSFFADRKRDAEVTEGVKCHRDFVALGTNEGGFEETVKCVHDHRIVPPAVVAPRLLCHFLQHKKKKWKPQHDSIPLLIP